MGEEAGRDYAEWLNLPLYSYADTDYLADVPRGTSRRWLAGYEYRDQSGLVVARPPVTPGGNGRGAASFLDLVEVAAIGELKTAGFSLRAIRRIVENCRELLGTDRPLVTQAFMTDGRDIFVSQVETLLDVGRRKGQRAWNELLEPFLGEIDYSFALARRWWPMGKDEPIVVDPEYGHGLPVVAHSGVRTEIILERFRAGDSQAEIAGDFNLEPRDVERALRFEVQRQPAA